MRPSKTKASPSRSPRSEWASFGYAFQGVSKLLATQPHARFHALATLVLLLLCIWLRPSGTQAAVLAVAAGSVWSAEAFNTCIEGLVDLVHPEWHERAGAIKDVAAAGVLLAAVAALVAGICVLGPLLYERLV